MPTYNEIAAATWLRAASLFQAGMDETLYELALEDEKGDEQGGNNQECGSCQERPLSPNFAELGKTNEASRQGPTFVAIGFHQRP